MQWNPLKLNSTSNTFNLHRNSTTLHANVIMIYSAFTLCKIISITQYIVLTEIYSQATFLLCFNNECVYSCYQNNVQKFYVFIPDWHYMVCTCM